MRTIRQLREKYTAEQLAWCARRFPAGLLQLGWVVLPEDAGNNSSSFESAHYMYAFLSSSVGSAGGRGRVPYFSSSDAALEWWQQHLVRRPAAAAEAAAKRRFKEAHIDPLNGKEVMGTRLWLDDGGNSGMRRQRTGYRGVARKHVAASSSGSVAGVVFEAKYDGTSLGCYGTAVEAAYAFAIHLRTRSVHLKVCAVRACAVLTACLSVLKCASCLPTRMAMTRLQSRSEWHLPGMPRPRSLRQPLA